MKNRVEQGRKDILINLIAKGWIILPFAFAGPLVLLPFDSGFRD